MRLLIKIGVLLLVVMAIAVNAIYWQDPWFYRRFVGMFLDSTADGALRPYDVVRGDKSYTIPEAKAGEYTVTQGALDAAVVYAKEFNSFAVLVIHGGKLQLEWYADGWSRERLTESQSMHKTLMGLFVGVAMEDGLIESVYDPVGKYIEEWHGDPRGDITLKQLMEMSSGLSQTGFGLNPFGNELKWLFSADSVRWLLETPLADWAPGEKYEYNNLNSELLGIVIERTTGKRYAEYLEEKLWRPMGGDKAHVWLDHEAGTAHTSCCLATPAMDWARFGMMLLHKGEVNGNRIVSEAWINEMVRPSAAASHYGYQIWLGYDDPPFPEASGSTQPIASEPYLARDTFLTWGRGQQHVWVVPSYDLVVLRLGPALGSDPIRPGFDVPKIPNLIIKGIDEKAGRASDSKRCCLDKTRQ